MSIIIADVWFEILQHCDIKTVITMQHVSRYFNNLIKKMHNTSQLLLILVPYLNFQSAFRFRQVNRLMRYYITRYFINKFREYMHSPLLYVNKTIAIQGICAGYNDTFCTDDNAKYTMLRFPDRDDMKKLQVYCFIAPGCDYRSVINCYLILTNKYTSNYKLSQADFA